MHALALVVLSAALARPGLAHLAESGYEWRGWPGDFSQLALMQGGRQVGAWNVLGGYYRALHADGSWGPPENRPPIDPPRADFGLRRDRLAGKDRYVLDGKEVGRHRVEQVLEERIPDHGSKFRLTVIGPADERDPVLQDLAQHPALARWRDRVLARGYDPTHWHVARAGFITTGRPTIYIQDAQGGVLHRQDDYQGGAAALALALDRGTERLRRPTPNYDPARDGDRRRASNPNWSLWALAGLAVVAWLVLRERRTS